jgi:hypothetical protein
MTESERIEIKYLVLSVCLTTVLMFFFALFTTQELRTIFQVEMTSTTRLWYIGFLVFYTVYGIRQFKIKFQISFPNLVFVLSSLFLVAFMYIFSLKSFSQNLSITSSQTKYEPHIYNSTVLFFRVLAISIGLTTIYALLQWIKRNRLANQ